MVQLLQPIAQVMLLIVDKWQHLRLVRSISRSDVEAGER
jgi:hypothetical protein